MPTSARRSPGTTRDGAPAPTLADVRAARGAIDGIAVRTPLVHAGSLSEAFATDVWLKLETLQPVGAFKVRGAANALAALTDAECARGVACASTGNHGRALAFAARRLGVRAVVCLSSLVPEEKVRAVEALGAEVRRVGSSQDDAQIEVDRLVAEEGLCEIGPFDDPAVIAGQGTIGLEILEDLAEPGTVVVPLSGGGFAGGVALAVKALRPDCRVVGVSMDRGAAMHESIAAGHVVEVDEVPSLADSLGGGLGSPNRYSFELCRRLLDATALVTEAQIHRGIGALFHHERLVAEGGGAVGVAALAAGLLEPFPGPLALVVSGRNIDPALWLRIAAGHAVAVGELEVGQARNDE